MARIVVVLPTPLRPRIPTICLPEASIELYRSILEEFAWYGLRLDEMHLHNDAAMDFEKDVDRLFTEREKLVGMRGEHFGVERKVAEAHLRFIGLLGSP